MDGRLIDATNGPTALVSILAEGGDPRSKEIAHSQLWAKALARFPNGRQGLESVPDVLGRLARSMRSGSTFHVDLPRPSGSRRKRGTQQLARNLGAAASMTVFAVDMISELRNAAERRRSTARPSSDAAAGSQPTSARAQGSKRVGEMKSAAPVKKVARAKKPANRKAAQTTRASPRQTPAPKRAPRTRNTVTR